MIGAAVIMAGAILAAAFQVSVAGLFPIGGATADLGLAAIITALVAGGPRAAMVMTPAVALSIALSSDLSPGVLLVGYTAVLPIGYALDRYGTPPGEFPRLLLMAVAAGVWVRTVLSLEAFVQGAEFAPFVLVRDVLVPGIVFDAAITGSLYVPLRLLGRHHLTFVTERKGWHP